MNSSCVSALCSALQCNGGAAGWARPCLFDLATNRPVLGNANICPFALMSTDAESLVSVMVHEVGHACRRLRLKWCLR